MLFATSCLRQKMDPGLEEIAGIIEDSPRVALQRLDSINDMQKLSERDRHYYDFLKIKARDKAYIKHTSDSLILDVIDYARSDNNKDWYVESLYYGGRVYSDLGDYPSALRYFQEALDHISEPKEMKLKGNILSQTGRLLHQLRLYSNAITFVEQSVEISKALKDTFGLAYDNRLLCLININNKNYAEAKEYNSEAFKYAQYMDETEIADMATDMASIYLEEGKIDSALNIIRPLPGIVDSLSRNYTLAIASRIYLEAGELDTAYMYGRELAMSPDSNNRRIGFKIIFSPEMEEFVPKDSLIAFMPIYKKEIESYLEEHEAQQAIIQSSNYNYQIHVRQRDKTEIQKFYITIALLVAILIIVGLTVVVLYLRFLNIKQQIRLRDYLEIIERINNSQSSDSGKEPNLKEKILKELNILENSTPLQSVSDIILESKEYKELKLLVKNGSEMNGDHWTSLEELVEKSSPGFKSKLKTLTNGSLTRGDYEIALLIHSGFIPSEMKILLNRSKSAVSSRRGELAKKIFESDSKIKSLDKLILGI